MERCVYCKEVEEKTSKIIYEDANVMAFMPDNAACIGHIKVITKKHFPIIELVPDKEIENIFKIVNRISTALFEAIETEGTNIIIENGTAAGQQIAHFTINIIPRKDKDGLNYQWRTKKIDEGEMASVEKKIKEIIDDKEEEETAIQSSPEKRPEPKKEEKIQTKEKKPEKEKPMPKEIKENYLIRQLERTP